MPAIMSTSAKRDSTNRLPLPRFLVLLDGLLLLLMGSVGISDGERAMLRHGKAKTKGVDHVLHRRFAGECHVTRTFALFVGAHYLDFVSQGIDGLHGGGAVESYRYGEEAQQYDHSGCEEVALEKAARQQLAYGYALKDGVSVLAGVSRDYLHCG